MITIKDLTVKNFMSVGNVTQAVRFTNNGLTLVLGNNLDLGGDGSRNGTGKTTIINALSYAIYGNALTNIRKDNLINKTNGKAMLVTLDFVKDGTQYRIERGRRPNLLKYYVNEQDVADDEAQGENRQTQSDIEKLFGMSHDMFKHIVALNTYTEPFLSMRANDQRAIIEQLLGITMLSEKAEVLKEQQRLTRDAIKEEEYRIKAIEEANARIEKSIGDLERRQKIWRDKQTSDLQSIQQQINTLEKIDIQTELNNHKLLSDYLEKKKLKDEAERWLSNIQSDNTKQQKLIDKLNKEINLLQDHKCHSCGQEIHDEKQESILNSKQEQLSDAQQQVKTNHEQEKESLLADMANAISHELNTPFGIINSGATAMKDIVSDLLEIKLGSSLRHEDFEFALQFAKSNEIEQFINGREKRKRALEFKLLLESKSYSNNSIDTIATKFVESSFPMYKSKEVDYVLQHEHPIQLLDLIKRIQQSISFSETISKTSSRATDVVKELTKLAKKEGKNEKVSVNIAENIQSILAVYKYKMDNAQISINIPKDAEIKAVESKLYQL